MKTTAASLTGMIFFLTVGSVMAEKPLRDYSFIRGACYPGGWRNSQAIIERDLGYAKKLSLPPPGNLWVTAGLSAAVE